MLNSLLIAQQSQQQQQVAAAAGTLEQLIRAAKLMEQRAVANNLLLAAGNTIGIGTGPAVQSVAAAVSAPFPIVAKLGEDYQERMLASKMRGTPFADPIVSSSSTYAAPNSTGSSRRSSPISAASSAPHSPDSTNNSQHHLLAASLAANPSVVAAAGGMLPTTSHQAQHTAAANIVRASSSASSSAQSNNGGNGGANPHSGSRRVSGSRQSRAAHNELEKNRRANLRGHLEALKSVLPPESDSHRDTTLSLLTRARNHIRFIKEQKCGLAERRAALLAEHLRLREMLQNGTANGIKIIMEEEEFNENNSQQNDGGLPAPKPMFASNILLAAASCSSSAQIGRQQNDVVEGNEAEEEEAAAICSAKPLDLNFLALNGLLPALPLLYPYNSLQTLLVIGSPSTSATPLAASMGELW